MRPTSRAQSPPALTTCSARIVPLSVTTSHVPSARAIELRDAREAIDLGAEIARRLRVRLRHAGRIDVPFERVVERADEVALVEQREELLRLVDGDDLHREAEVARAGARELQEVHPLRRAGEIDAAGDVDAARLARRAPRSPRRA